MFTVGFLIGGLIMGGLIVALLGWSVLYDTDNMVATIIRLKKEM